VFAGRSLDAKRAQYQVLVANLSALVGYGFFLKCRQRFGASRIRLISASGSTSSLVWTLQSLKSEWRRGSVERQAVSRDSVLRCKWRRTVPMEKLDTLVTDLSELMLKDRIAELKAIRDQARADTERADGAIERQGPIIPPDRSRHLPGPPR
jgi:hypothetical protein